MIKAGELREAVVIESPVEVPNDFGETEVTWQEFARRRARIDGIVVRETSDAQGNRTVASHDVSFRYVPGLTADMRIVWTSRTPSRVLDVLSIAELNNREEHRLTCAEQVTR